MACRPLAGRAWAAALALLLAACAPPTLPAPQRSELVIGIVGEPASIVDDPSAAAVAALIYEPLVRRTDTEELEPRLAEMVPTRVNGGAVISEDAEGTRLVATFRIRDGARWHDGTPVHAEDIRFAFEHDRAAAPGSAIRTAAERIERIDVVDERAARVSYRAGERWDLYALAPRALPRHLLGGTGSSADQASRPIHAGPYLISTRGPGSIELVPFAGHVIDRPGIDRILVRTFADRTALLAAIGRGLVDVAPFPALDADLARTLDRTADGTTLQVFYRPAQAVAMLRVGPAFSEGAVRRAIAVGIDRERISRSVFSGRVRAPNSYLVPPLWAAAEIGTGRGPDPVEAAGRLSAAGFRRGAFGMLQRDGVQLAGTLLVPRGSPSLEDVGFNVAADLAALGMAIAVSEPSAAEIEDRVSKGDFDLALLPEPADDPLDATDRYRGLVSPWFDLIADAARVAPGRAEQRSLYEELQRLWSEASPAVPLYQILKVDVVPARLEGVRPAAHGAPITWNAGEWRVATH
jgi:peptide/nickel transport system substrate-binding protein